MQSATDCGRISTGQCEAKIAALERLVGRQALEIEFSKASADKRTAAEKRDYMRYHRPNGISIVDLMGLPRFTHCDPAQ